MNATHLHELLFFTELFSTKKALLALTVAIATGQGIVGALRWHVTLAAVGTKLPPFFTLKLVYISMFFNLFLPGAVIGEAVRVFKAHNFGLSLTHAIHSVLLERLAMVLGLFPVVSFALLLPANHIKNYYDTSYISLISVLLGLLFLTCVVLLDRLPSTLNRFQITHQLSRLAKDARNLLLHGRYAIWLLLYVIVGHLSSVYIAFLLAHELAINVTFADCLTLIPTVILLSSLPISIAGLGIREYAMVTAFSLLGVSRESSFALSILFGFTTLVGTLPGGVFWLANLVSKDSLIVD